MIKSNFQKIDLGLRGCQKLKANASCRRPQQLKNCKTCQNQFLQKYIILEGFRRNGYQIRIQRKKLRISALVKIDFGHFLKNVNIRDL